MLTVILLSGAIVVQLIIADQAGLCWANRAFLVITVLIAYIAGMVKEE